MTPDEQERSLTPPNALCKNPSCCRKWELGYLGYCAICCQLRDQFAMAALNLLCMPVYVEISGYTKANIAYEMADDMLYRRKIVK